MTEIQRLRIIFDDLEVADGGTAAESLRRTLLDMDPELSLKRIRHDCEAMDFGSVLEIALAAPAVVSLVKGLTAWLAQPHRGSISITDEQGKIIVKNVSSRTVSDIAMRLGPQQRQGRVE